MEVIWYHRIGQCKTMTKVCSFNDYAEFGFGISNTICRLTSSSSFDSRSTFVIITLSPQRSDFFATLSKRLGFFSHLMVLLLEKLGKSGFQFLFHILLLSLHSAGCLSNLAACPCCFVHQTFSFNSPILLFTGGWPKSCSSNPRFWHFFCFLHFFLFCHRFCLCRFARTWQTLV